MADERVQRRLAAILAADVAGYSHLMELDEERTHRVFQTCHAKITKIVSGYRGRVFGGADFSLHSFMQTEPFKQETDAIHLLDGLRKAGLPE